MPTHAKILSEEERSKYEFAMVEDIQPEFIQDFGNQEQLDQVVFRLFAPHAYTARQEYEAKKNEQKRRKEWLETIVNSQNSLQSTQDKVRQLASANKNKGLSAR